MPPDWPIHHHETLDSTSDEARRLLESGALRPPFVVRADRQTRGRGQRSNTWWSDSGSLMFTVALDMHGIDQAFWSRHPLIAACAVIDAATEAVPGLLAGIRWPNDIDVSGRKLAGILPERPSSPGVDCLTLGIGVNVSTRFDAAPADVRANATSLAEHSHTPIDPTSLLLEILARLDAYNRGDPRGQPDRWRQLDTLNGRTFRVRQGDRVVAAVGRGIDERGFLLIDTEEGRATVASAQILRD